MRLLAHDLGHLPYEWDLNDGARSSVVSAGP